MSDTPRTKVNITADDLRAFYETAEDNGTLAAWANVVFTYAGSANNRIAELEAELAAAQKDAAHYHQKSEMLSAAAFESEEKNEKELAAARRETAEKVREACEEAAGNHECHTWAECCDCRGKIQDAIRALDLSPFTGQEEK